jgi:hypothetical protein
LPEVKLDTTATAGQAPLHEAPDRSHDADKADDGKKVGDGVVGSVDAPDDSCDVNAESAEIEHPSSSPDEAGMAEQSKLFDEVVPAIAEGQIDDIDQDTTALFTGDNSDPASYLREDWELLVNLDTPKSLSLSSRERSPPDRSKNNIVAKRTAPNLLYTPVHMSTMLVEYWFSDVCGMWSAFDSEKNPNRQMAFSTWQSSEPVYYAMQCMSATCLIDSLPHIKEQVSVLSAQAVDAIERGVADFLSLDSMLTAAVPTDLLLAIFAMGTSVCWADTRQLGIWFLGKAQEVLAHCEGKDLDMDPAEMKDLMHFREAMVYWEMLSRVVGW